MSNYSLNQLINQGIEIDPQEISFLDSATNYATSLLQEIAQASQRVLLNMLYLENDQAGEQLIQTLIARKEQQPHLEIKIIVDFHRSHRLRFGDTSGITNQQWYQKRLQQFNQQLLDQNASPIEIYGMQVNTSELMGVYHIKGNVIDNCIFYTGASVNNIYFGLSTYRQDRYQIIRSPLLADKFYKFISKYFANQHAISLTLPSQVSPSTLKSQARIYRKRVLTTAIDAMNVDQRESYSKQHYSELIDNNQQLTATLIYGLGAKNNILNKTILALLEATQQQILLYTPYFNPTNQFKKAIKRLLYKKKKVILVLGDKTASDFFVVPGSKAYHRSQALPYLYEINLYRFLKKNQYYLDQGFLEIRLWKNANNSYHVKGISVDQQLHLLTGHNLNPRGFYADAENAILLNDPQHKLKDKLQQEQNFIFQHTTIITSYRQIDTFNKYPAEVKRTLKRYRLFLLDHLAKFLL